MGLGEKKAAEKKQTQTTPEPKSGSNKYDKCKMLVKWANYDTLFFWDI